MTLIKIQKHVYQVLALLALTIVEECSYSVEANTTDTYDHCECLDCKMYVLVTKLTYKLIIMKLYSYWL